MNGNEENVTPTLRAFQADVFALKSPVSAASLEAEALKRLVDQEGFAISIQDLDRADRSWITTLVAAQRSQDKRIKVSGKTEPLEHLRVSVTNKELLYLDGVSFESAAYPTGTWLQIAVELIGDPEKSTTLELQNAIPNKIACALPPGAARWTHYYIIEVA